MPPAKSILWITLTLLAAFFTEAAIYRRGWYNRYIEPDSAAGSVEYPLYWLQHFRPPADRPEILVVGDSRVAEGFSAPQADEESGYRSHFWNIGIPGSDPRVWYYFLRDADPTRRRFQAIVIALDYYNDEDQYDNLAGRVYDVNFVVARLRATDILDFARSMSTPEDQRTAFLGATLKGTVLAQDARLFLNGIRARKARSQEVREKGLWYLDHYGGFTESLAGLTADYQARTIHFPPGLDEARQNSIRDALMPNLPPNTGKTTAYRKLWLGRILEMYARSRTRIVLFESSRGPLPQPERQGPMTFLNSVRAQRNVILLDQKAFRDFESPELYFDGLHYNHEGRAIFTARFTKILMGVL